METQTSNDDVFYVGICMAGAVSAGAYTAGVIDYLTEALEKYEAYRAANAGTAGAPKHKVVIPVMGGASAGGMTSIITAAALQQPFQHITGPGADPLADRPENGLYHSWVDLQTADMFPVMMGNDDITRDKEVVSLFNSDFIDEIAGRMLTPEIEPKWQPLPSYFSERLKVFVTLSNLQGFTYDVAFHAPQVGDRHPYYMQIHNDFACFQVCNQTDQTAEDGWIPWDLPGKVNREIAKEAAMATGAFPVGLKSRYVTRPSAAVEKSPFLKKYLEGNPIKTDDYRSLNVDGGMIDNEPFENVREVLSTITGQTDPKDYESYKKFNSTVVMIAPFPSEKPQDITFGQKLFHVMGLTLSAILSQMLAKPEQMVNAWNPDCAGQFLIDPSRSGADANSKILGERAIACGAMDGFSGFLNKDFRVHDYFLGRYNCHVFLKDYFTIPDEHVNDNPIFNKSYATPNDETRRFRGKTGYQIIPILDDTPPTEPKWPVQKWSLFSRFKEPIKSRIEKIILNITKLEWYWYILLWLGSYIVIRPLLAGKVLGIIKDDLETWGLLED